MADGWHAAHASALVTVTSPGCFAFQGPDARRFLNGMFTNNVSSQAVGTCRRHGICDNKGRLLGLLDLWCTDDDRFVAVLDGIEHGWFEARYTKYIVFDDVELSDVSERYRSVVLAGPDASKHVPDGVMQAALPLAVPAVQLLLAASDVPAFEGVEHGTEADLELLRIEAGRPRFPVDVGERDGPHVMGFVAEIVAFDKGCYIGQETIHRIDAMGKVKRHFSAMRVQGDDPVDVGAEVRVGERKVGVVTTSAVLPGVGPVALGVLKEPGSEPGQVVSIGERSAVTVAAPDWGAGG